MKTIILPTHPKYCYLTYDTKEKTIDIRKTCPEPPFKVLTYMTCDLHGVPGVTEWFHPNFGKYRALRGNVIGEFICEKVDDIFPFGLGSAIVDSDGNVISPESIIIKSCLSEKQLENYLGEKGKGVALHITAPRLYDEPRELREFYKYLPEKILGSGDYDCRKPWNCACMDYPEGGDDCHDCEYGGKKRITRAPQSWRYIEDPEEV